MSCGTVGLHLRTRLVRGHRRADAGRCKRPQAERELHLGTGQHPSQPGVTVSDNLSNFDFASATESERVAYDYGREDAVDPARLDMEDIITMLDAVLAALVRLHQS